MVRVGPKFWDELLSLVTFSIISVQTSRFATAIVNGGGRAPKIWVGLRNKKQQKTQQKREQNLLRSNNRANIGLVPVAAEKRKRKRCPNVSAWIILPLSCAWNHEWCWAAPKKLRFVPPSSITSYEAICLKLAETHGMIKMVLFIYCVNQAIFFIFHRNIIWRSWSFFHAQVGGKIIQWVFIEKVNKFWAWGFLDAFPGRQKLAHSRSKRELPYKKEHFEWWKVKNPSILVDTRTFCLKCLPYQVYGFSLFDYQWNGLH